MARRGRFGTPSGGANLSALVQGLLRQKKAQEEQLIMQQFRNGQKTLSEVLAFYEDWRSTAGYSTGSVEYDQIVQSMNDAKNQDLVQRYNKLWSDFNTSNGANYQDVMDFLNNDASNTTDQGNLQSFNEAKKTATQNFIKYAGEQLSQGAMSLDEYKSLINENLPLAYEDSPSQLASAQYDALVVEYNASKSIWDNRIAAGKPGAVDGFQNFANSFIKQMNNSEIPANSELYTAVQAGMANARVSGSNVAVERSLGIQDKLGKLFGMSALATGANIPAMNQSGVASGATYSLQNVMDHPEVFASLIRQVDAGVIEMPQELIDMGIDTTDELAKVVTNDVNANYNALKAAYSINPTAQLKAALDGAKNLKYTIGTQTGVDELADAVDQYATDMQNAYATNDTVAGLKAKTQWENYLNGKTSDYGKMPSDSELNIPGAGNYGAYLLSAINVSKNALAGNDLGPNPRSIESWFGHPIGSDGTNAITFDDYYAQNGVQVLNAEWDALRGGQAVQSVTYDKNGIPSYEVTPRSSVGPGGQVGFGAAYATGGVLNIMTFVDMGGGQVVPIVQGLNNFQTVQISTAGSSTLSTWGYVYKLPSGEVVYYGKDGNAYKGSPFASGMGTGPNNAVTPLGDSSISGAAVKYDGTPTIDTQSLLTIAGGGDPTKATYSSIRATVDSINGIINDPAYADLVASVTNGRDGLLKGINEVTNIANGLELKDLTGRLTSISRRGGVDAGAGADEINLVKTRINDITNKTTTSENYKIYMQNKNKYDIQPDGTYKLKPISQTSGYSGTGSDLIGATDQYGNQLPQIIDPLLKSERDSRNALIAGTQSNPYARNALPFFRNVPDSAVKPFEFPKINIDVSQSGVPASPTVTPTVPVITTPLAPGQRPGTTWGGK